MGGIQRLLSWKLALHGVDPLQGDRWRSDDLDDRRPPRRRLHRLPGANLYAKLGGIRLQVAAATRPDQITSVNSDKKLDVFGASTADGTKVIQWPQNGGLNQQWRLVLVSVDVYAIVSARSGKVLDVEGASLADGAPVIQWPWNGGANQRWRISLVT